MSIINSNPDGSNPVERESEICVKMSKHMADDLLSFVEQTITDAQETLNTVNPEDKLLVGV